MAFFKLNLTTQYKENHYRIFRNPTPDGVDLPSGIPKWPAYNANTEYYMAIDRDWQIKVDYTQTYTVTVDELNPTAGNNLQEPVRMRPAYQRNH